MTETRCGEMASVFMAWGGKQVPCCEEHAQQLRAVGAAIGMTVEGVANYNDEITCTQVVQPQVSAPPKDGEPGVE